MDEKHVFRWTARQPDPVTAVPVGLPPKPVRGDTVMVELGDGQVHEAVLVKFDMGCHARLKNGKDTPVFVPNDKWRPKEAGV